MPWTRPTLPQLILRVGAGMKSRLSGIDPYLRWVAEKVLGIAVAGLAHELHGHIAFIGDNIVPNPKMDAQYLAQWAALKKITQKPATKATGTVAVSGAAGTNVPSGSVLQRADGVQFVTTAAGTTTGGDPVSIPVQAKVGGFSGNCDTGEPLTFIVPIANVNSTVAVNAAPVSPGVGGTTGLTGGLDAETPAQLYSRLQILMSNPPKGGGDGDYVNWALSRAGVTRAWCIRNMNGIGTVGVIIASDTPLGSIIASSDLVADVQAFIDGVKPTTATVQVLSIVPIGLTPTIKLTPNTTEVQNAVAAELKDLALRQTVIYGPTDLSVINAAIASAPGWQKHTLVLPTTNPVQFTVVGTITWVAP